LNKEALTKRRNQSANPTWLVAPIAALGAGFVFANLGPHLGPWQAVVGPGAVAVTAGVVCLGLIRGRRKAKLTLKNGVLRGFVGNVGWVNWEVRDLQSRILRWHPPTQERAIGLQVQLFHQGCQDMCIAFGTRVELAGHHRALSPIASSPDKEIPQASFAALCSALGKTWVPA
jgi:hypothetical protein